MSDDHPTLSLFELVDILTSEDLHQWRKQNCRDVPTADLLAGPLRAIEVTVTIRPAGRALATVSLHARRRWDDEVYVHHLSRLRHRHWTDS